MPIEDSRNKGGTLTLDAQPFAKQATSVALNPSEETNGEDLETLDGSTIEADETTTWELDLGVVQDFTDPAGIVEFSRQNAGDVVPFTWAPNGATGPSYTGSVRVRALPIGGEVNTRLTSTKSWPVVGQPSVTYPGP